MVAAWTWVVVVRVVEGTGGCGGGGGASVGCHRRAAPAAPIAPLDARRGRCTALAEHTCYWRAAQLSNRTAVIPSNSRQCRSSVPCCLNSGVRRRRTERGATAATARWCQDGDLGPLASPLPAFLVPFPSPASVMPPKGKPDALAGREICAPRDQWPDVPLPRGKTGWEGTEAYLQGWE